MPVFRGHHLLCINFFQGKGYSTDFVKNMKKIVENFDKNPQLKIKLIAGCDIICRHCPNCKNDRCSNGYNRVKNRDKKVLQALGYEPGSVIQVERVMAEVEQLLAEKELSYFCQHCEWFSICSSYLI